MSHLFSHPSFKPASLHFQGKANLSDYKRNEYNARAVKNCFQFVNQRLRFRFTHLACFINNRLTFLRVALCLSLCLFFASGCSPKIEGRVTDNFGKPLADVAITVIDSKEHTESHSDGEYSIKCRKKIFELRFKKEGYLPVIKPIERQKVKHLNEQHAQLWKIPPKQGIYYIGADDYIVLEPITLEYREETQTSELVRTTFISKTRTYIIPPQVTVPKFPSTPAPHLIDTLGTHEHFVLVKDGVVAVEHYDRGVNAPQTIPSSYKVERVDHDFSETSMGLIDHALPSTPGTYAFLQSYMKKSPYETNQYYGIEPVAFCFEIVP